MSDTRATRLRNWEALVEFYAPSDTALGEFDPETERFALVQDSYMDEKAMYGEATFQEACEHLSNDVLDQWIPEAIYDLDTGERIALHVADPVVSRSEDEGAVGLLDNPLQEHDYEIEGGERPEFGELREARERIEIIREAWGELGEHFDSLIGASDYALSDAELRACDRIGAVLRGETDLIDGITTKGGDT
jgi:hypothetical protein